MHQAARTVAVIARVTDLARGTLFRTGSAAAVWTPTAADASGLAGNTLAVAALESAPTDMTALAAVVRVRAGARITGAVSSAVPPARLAGEYTLAPLAMGGARDDMLRACGTNAANDPQIVPPNPIGVGHHRWVVVMIVVIQGE